MIDQLVIKSVHEIIKIYILITYISNMIFCWSLDNKNTIDKIITWNYWTVVQFFEYFINVYKNNKRLSQSIDQLMIKSVYEIIEKSVFITYISNMFFNWLLEDKIVVDTIIT